MLLALRRIEKGRDATGLENGDISLKLNHYLHHLTLLQMHHVLSTFLALFFEILVSSPIFICVTLQWHSKFLPLLYF